MKKLIPEFVTDALDKRAKKIYARTAETDVIAVLVGIFSDLQSKTTDIDVWVAFGMGRHFQFYHVNSICQHLGERKCKGLPFFHAITGSDKSSQFLGKAKKSS